MLIDEHLENIEKFQQENSHALSTIQRKPLLICYWNFFQALISLFLDG